MRLMVTTGAGTDSSLFLLIVAMSTILLLLQPPLSRSGSSSSTRTATAAAFTIFRPQIWRTGAFHTAVIVDERRTRRRRADVVRLFMINTDDKDSRKEPENNTKDDSAGSNNMFDFLSPYESKIPKAIVNEIYSAEAKTPAAQNRTVRIGIYTSVAIIGILMAFFNAFVSELRTTPDVDGNILSLYETGFGWVVDNPISSFLFTNKIGGGLCLLLGGGGGLLAEAEYDTRRLNAERIYEELVRRRTEREEQTIKRTGGGASSSTSSAKPKKKRRNKTLDALAEVVGDDYRNERTTSSRKQRQQQQQQQQRIPTVEEPEPMVSSVKESKEQTQEQTPASSLGNNLLDKMKEMYQKADTMAASQALLLNKQLEEKGILEKITDESGLKVIGKEAAAVAAAKNKEENETSATSFDSVNDPSASKKK